MTISWDFCIVVIFICIGLIILYLLIDLIGDIKSLIFKNKWTINVSSTRLVSEIVLFTNDILWDNGIKNFPHCKVSYYRHKKYLGYYSNSTIVIFINNHKDPDSIVNTILHEISHFIKDLTDKEKFDKYEVYARRFGYILNPLELECHLFAHKWSGACMDHLHLLGIISKAC